MDNINVWLVILLVSIIFGIFDRYAAYNEKGKSWWFFEWWRLFVNYFITGAIGYFLVVIRWPKITELNNLSINDFVLCLAFFIGVLGWWPYFIKNITEGINTIIERFLKK